MKIYLLIVEDQREKSDWVNFFSVAVRQKDKQAGRAYLILESDQFSYTARI